MYIYTYTYILYMYILYICVSVLYIYMCVYVCLYLKNANFQCVMERYFQKKKTHRLFKITNIIL